MRRIGVIGAGAWGTTIAKVAAENGNDVQLWSYQESDAVSINESHSLERLPGITLPSLLTASTDMETVAGSKDLLIVALASDHLDVLTQIARFCKDVPALVLTKGLLEGKDSLFVSDCIKSIMSPSDLAILSGPNIAIEIAQEKPAATVIACERESVAKEYQTVLNRPYFRPYTAIDVKGVELGGVLKNAIAIAAGVCDGLELGANAKSALITRALHEISQIAVHWGAKKETVMGLSGLGDLITTCTSPNSRNYSFGFKLSSAQDAKSALAANTTTTEGVKTARVVTSTISKDTLEIPIFRAIAAMLDGQIEPSVAIATLMNRELKAEL